MSTATAKNGNAIEAQVRSAASRGKNEARRLRVSGRIPAVVYGAKKETIAVSVDPKEIARILQSETGHNTIFDLKLGDESTKAMIVDWQTEPIKGKLIHIDMKRIAMHQKLRVKVPILLTGTPEGVKSQGGILEQVLREVELECLPSNIPNRIEADVTALVFGQVLRVSDLGRSSDMKFLTDENQTVAHITAVKEEVAPTPEAAAEAAAVPAEPEVIKKGKQETEEGAPAAAAPAVEGKAEKAEKGEKKEKK